jgi:hypothetical protein
MLRAMTVMAAFWLIASPVSAQPAEPGTRGVASSFEQLRVLVDPGARIVITDVNGRPTTGVLTALSPASLSLRVNGALLDFGEADVALVRQRRNDPLGNGALWGMGIGVGLVGAAALRCQCPEDSEFMLLGAALYAALGAGLGVGIDAMVKRDQVIYHRPAPEPGRVRVTPIVGRHVRGASIALGF